MSVQQHKPGAPVVGFNHNIQYKGRTFHVQTEDSGAAIGHYITHIFVGGNILASKKTSYADQVAGWAEGDIFANVRRLMEEQHKAMLKGLTQGQHDTEIERRTAVASYAPGVLAGGVQAPGLLTGGEASGKSAPAPARPAAAPAAPKPAPVAPAAVAAAPAPKPAPAPVSKPAVRPAPRETTTFGEGLVSDKSLDEVILSYLSADLDGNKR